jgi:hypothetical protein
MPQRNTDAAVPGFLTETCQAVLNLPVRELGEGVGRIFPLSRTGEVTELFFTNRALALAIYPAMFVLWKQSP